MFNAEKVFADYIKPGFWQKKVNVCNAAGVGVFNRNDGQINLFFMHKGHGFFKSVAGNIFLFRKKLAGGNLGIGAGHALISDF